MFAGYFFRKSEGVLNFKIKDNISVIVTFSALFKLRFKIGEFFSTAHDAGYKPAFGAAVFQKSPAFISAFFRALHVIPAVYFFHTAVILADVSYDNLSLTIIIT